MLRIVLWRQRVIISLSNTVLNTHLRTSTVSISIYGIYRYLQYSYSIQKAVESSYIFAHIDPFRQKWMILPLYIFYLYAPAPVGYGSVFVCWNNVRLTENIRGWKTL